MEYTYILYDYVLIVNIDDSKALDCARESDDQIKDEIWRELARVKYAEWEQAAKHRKEDQDYLRERLYKMMDIVHKQEINTSVCTLSEKQTKSLHDVPLIDTPMHNMCCYHVQVDLVNTQCRQDEERAGLERLFDLAARQDVPQEPSSIFTCNLTMEVYREPVIVPSGLSYERSALNEHLSKVGRFDPVSRDHLSQEDIRPNLALRAATQEYLDEHPWAWKECI